MSQCIRSNKDKNKRIITQISEYEYLIEGQADWARFGCQSDISIITSANIDGGPFLLVGDNFLGKGTISSLQNIDSGKDGYLIVKITLFSNKEK
jgi:hypothetical protein